MKKRHEPGFVFRVYKTSRLRKFPPVEPGDSIECLTCGRNHDIFRAYCISGGRRDSLFMVYKCGRTWEIGAIFGRMIAGRRPDVEVKG